MNENLKQKINEVFESNPTAEMVFVTEDEQIFLNRNSASNHSRTIKKGNVSHYTRTSILDEEEVLAAKEAEELAAKEAEELAAKEAKELAAKEAKELAAKEAEELAAKEAEELAKKEAEKTADNKPNQAPKTEKPNTKK